MELDGINLCCDLFSPPCKEGNPDQAGSRKQHRTWLRSSRNGNDEILKVVVGRIGTVAQPEVRDRTRASRDARTGANLSQIRPRGVVVRLAVVDHVGSGWAKSEAELYIPGGTN